MHLHFDTVNILVTLAGVANLLYGFIVWERGKKLSANQTFFLFAVTVALWSFAMVLFRSAETTREAILLARLLYVAAAAIPVAFVYFALTFEATRSYSRLLEALVALPMFFVMWMAFTPGVLISDVILRPSEEPFIVFVFGFHIVYFLYVAVYALAVFIVLLVRRVQSSGTTKIRLSYILVGTSLPWIVSIATNVVLLMFGNFDYNWFGQISTFFSTSIITYGIFRSRLFDVRIVATELLVFTLWVVLFTQIVLSDSSGTIITNVIILALLVIAGLLLVRSVYREIEQREMIEIQGKELGVANQQQESLLHFISHEIKGYLTKNEAAFAAIAAGDFGPVTDGLKSMSSSALSDTRKGVATVMDILDASNLKKGMVSYSKQRFDLSTSLSDVVADFEQTASEKGLQLLSKIQPGVSLVGDEGKIRRHVLRNLVDNSIKYTPSGAVSVSLSSGTALRITVEDTGVGITHEDMAHLFTEGGHGKESIKINVHSTGYGLFIAKQVVEAHSGRIWAESEGKSKGSRFIVEFPAGV